MTQYWAFDIEVYPNFFGFVGFNISNGCSPEEVSKGLGISHPDVIAFTYSDSFGINNLDALQRFLENPEITLVGFNSLYYDSPVMDYVLSERPSNLEIFEFSKSVIERLNGGTRGSYRKRVMTWDEIDMMKAYAFDALGVSLKQVSINLQWHRVQDLPFPFDYRLTMEDIMKVVEYNLNDVLITAKLYNVSTEMLDLRRELSFEYGVDLRSASDSRMANLILNSIYSAETGNLDFIGLRTQRKIVWLRNCIGKGISFKTKKLQSLLRKIMDTVVVAENNFAFKESIDFGNCRYEIGVGGLHSVDGGASFSSDDSRIIQDADVASFYPNIILINEIIPAHLDHRFIDILRRITAERIQAKRDGNKIKADGLKITINSIFGKLNSDTFWLQDAQAMLSVTLSGQLYLLMLIERLMLAGIPTISANTDGIVCSIPKELENDYYDVCRWWQNETGFELEYTQYQGYHRIDVNNYITEKTGGTTKEKGRLVTDISLKKGYRHPIVPTAIYEYLINGIPVMDTLKSSTNILDFCISQKAGNQFLMEYYEDDFELRKILQKNNRYFISTDGGHILKTRKEHVGKMYLPNSDGRGGEYYTKDEMINMFGCIPDGASHAGGIGIAVGETLVVLNDFDEKKPIDEYKIKYQFYYDEAMKYIEKIEKGTFNLDLVMEELGDDEIDTSTLVKLQDDIEILPPKFRLSTGTYRYDEESGVIYRGIASIKYITEDMAQRLYSFRHMEYNTFFDFLVHNKTEIGLNSRQITILIKVDFFSEFGKNKKLLSFYEEFSKIYKVGQSEKTTQKKKERLLNLWNEIPNKAFSVREQIAFELEILGLVQSTFNQDNRTYYVLSIDTTYSPKLKILHLATAEVMDAKIQKRIHGLTYRQDKKGKHYLDAGDFFMINEIERKPAVRKGKAENNEPEWVELDGVYNNWIMDYDIL